MTYQRILLTGATGFVGRRLAAALRDRLPQADGFFLARKDDSPGPAGWEPKIGDLADPQSVHRVVAEATPDLVVHLGAATSVAQSFTDPNLTWTTNLIGSQALAYALSRCGKATVVLNVSSGDVYGDSFRLGAASEQTPPRPLSPYARSKLAAEFALDDILATSARLINARAFAHSGPGQMATFVLPAFAAQVARIEAGLQPPRLEVGNLNVQRDFLHVCDVIEAYMQLLFPKAQLPSRITINIASGTAIALSDIVAGLRARSRIPFDVVVDQRRVRAVDISEVTGDATQLRELTGWRPSRSIDKLLDELLEDWRQRLSSNPSAAGHRPSAGGGGAG